MIKILYFQNINQNRKLRIKDNPGFATKFEMEKFTTNLVVSMSGINSTHYLDIIPIYLSSIVEMTQGTESELVKSVCSAKPIVEEKAIEEIKIFPQKWGNEKIEKMRFWGTTHKMRTHISRLKT